MANQTNRQAPGAGQPRRRHERRYDEAGQATYTLLFVIVIIIAALYLLTRTEAHAQHIDHEAKIIASTGRGINQDTDSIIELNHTEQVAQQIQGEAAPVTPAFLSILGVGGQINATAGTILGSATQINKDATAINGSATSILGTANSINGTANAINGTAGQILNIAGDIQNGVHLINANVDVTLGIAQGILGNSNAIVNEANEANKESCAIDVAVNLGGASC